MSRWEVVIIMALRQAGFDYINLVAVEHEMMRQ
jgi:hypothetical protein